MKYSEITLKSWCQPASASEDQRINHSINMIRDAIHSSFSLKNLDIEVFVQGSYGNNTNVRSSSDVDVCIMLKNTFFSEFPDGLTNSDYGFTSPSISYNQYKQYVLEALIQKFGPQSITLGNKSIKIRSNTYHVETDAVVAFMLKDFRSINSRIASNYIEGIEFISNDGHYVKNFPKEHIANGREKNIATNHQYKNLVRIFKHIRNDMVDCHKINGDIISSFLVECLIWNVPNPIIMQSPSWKETVRNSLIYIYQNLCNNNASRWREVSGQLYLFSNHKWSITTTTDFIVLMWNYLGFADEEY